MKVLFFIGSLTGGGAERVVCNLASYLSLHGHQVEILTVTKLKDHYTLDDGVKVVSLDDNLKSHNKFYSKVEKILNLIFAIKKLNNDVNVVFLPKTIMLFMLFKKFISSPIVLSERNNPESYGKLMQLVMRFCFNKADKCVFQTKEAMMYYMHKGVSENKCVVIPNAVEIDDTEEKAKLDYTIVAAGRFTEQKNFFLLLKAFKKIHIKYQEYKLIIYGDGPLREKYEEFLRVSNLEDCVKLPGYIGNLHQKIKNANMFVLSSDYEGIPNVLMEAMALGIPCIATDCPCGGPKMLIKNGYNGILINVKAEDMLVAAIQKYIEDASFAEKCAEKAKLVKDKFSPQKIYKQWEDVLIETIL